MERIAYECPKFSLSLSDSVLSWSYESIPSQAQTSVVDIKHGFQLVNPEGTYTCLLSTQPEGNSDIPERVDILIVVSNELDRHKTVGKVVLPIVRASEWISNAIGKHSYEVRKGTIVASKIFIAKYAYEKLYGPFVRYESGGKAAFLERALTEYKQAFGTEYKDPDHLAGGMYDALLERSVAGAIETLLISVDDSGELDIDGPYLPWDMIGAYFAAREVIKSEKISHLLDKVIDAGTEYETTLRQELETYATEESVKEYLRTGNIN